MPEDDISFTFGILPDLVLCLYLVLEFYTHSSELSNTNANYIISYAEHLP